jgi:hypothetical protein
MEQAAPSAKGVLRKMKVVATNAAYELPLILSTHTNARLFLRQL